MSGVIDQLRLSSSACDFIDEPFLNGLLERKPEASQVRDVIAKSLTKTPLEIE